MILFRKHIFKLTIALLTLIVGLIAASLWKSHYDVCLPNQPSQCSMLKGRTVHLVPSGFKFDVPQAWIDWQAEFHDNFHLTRWQLYKVKKSSGEWDYEYGEVANAVLPFEMCALHAGDEGWGRNGASFGDLQLRVYVGDWALADIKNRLATDGFSQANRVAKDARTTSGRHGAWQRETISYEVFYSDYGGTATVDFYSRPHKSKTVVFVFMHAQEHADAINRILESFA